MIDYQEILAARKRIAPYVQRTPLLRLPALDAYSGMQTYIKPECFQNTGAFKIRGAFNRLLQLSEQEKAAGVIGASSGNHGLGLSTAAKHLGIRAIIVMPENASEIKLNGIKKAGAEVMLHGLLSSERNQFMRDLAARQKLTIVHAFEDPIVCAGQASAAMEMLEDCPDLDAVVVQAGGGGLLSAFATAIKNTNPLIKVIGIEPAAAPRYAISRAKGSPQAIEIDATIADGTRGNAASPHNFEIIEQYVDELYSVDDDALKAAIYLYAKLGKMLPEPSGALPLAAAIDGKLKHLAGAKVGFLISGGNGNLGEYDGWFKEGAAYLQANGFGKL